MSVTTRLRSLMKRRHPLALPLTAGYMLARYAQKRPFLTASLVALGGAAPGISLYVSTHLTPPAHTPKLLIAPENDAAYAVTDLGTLGGDFSQAGGINGRGKIVGASRTGDNRSIHGFLYQNGKMSDMGTIGGKFSAARAINESGQAVGFALEPNNKYVHAFVYQNGKMRDINPRGAVVSMATAINSGGAVTGIAAKAEGEVTAFLRQGDKMETIGALPECDFTVSRDINAQNQIVGCCASEDDALRAFVWQKGRMRELPGLNGPNAYAIAINNTGVIAGGGFAGGGISHAVVWKDGKPFDLGTIPGYPASSALGLNKGGDIVGVAYDPQENAVIGLNFQPASDIPFAMFDRQENVDFGEKPEDAYSLLRWLDALQNQKLPHGVLWRSGKATDLNDLLPANSGWVIAVPTGINDNGQIVGIGLHNGQVRAFLLTPKR